MEMTKELHPAFRHNQYLFRRRAVSAGTFDVYDQSGRLLLYSKQNPLKFADDFRLYSHEHQEVLTMRTPKTIKEGQTYKVQDATTGELVGSIALAGPQFLLREEWIFLSTQGRQIGKLTENVIWGLLHRIIRLIPQRYVIVSGDGRTIAKIRQHFKLWVLKYTMTILEPHPLVDRRLLLSSVILTGTEAKFIVPS